MCSLSSGRTWKKKKPEETKTVVASLYPHPCSLPPCCFCCKRNPCRVPQGRAVVQVHVGREDWQKAERLPNPGPSWQQTGKVRLKRGSKCLQKSEPNQAATPGTVPESCMKRIQAKPERNLPRINQRALDFDPSPKFGANLQGSLMLENWSKTVRSRLPPPQGLGIESVSSCCSGG